MNYSKFQDERLDEHVLLVHCLSHFLCDSFWDSEIRTVCVVNVFGRHIQCLYPRM